MSTLLHPRRTSGFSLIEVLIALVILSVGLLGIAAMVSVSLKSKDSSYSQTQATALAESILDRMRANRSTASGGGYDTALTDAPTQKTCLGTGHPCSAADIATFDLYDWKTQLVNTLGPDAQGSVATVAVDQMTQVTVTIQWNDARANQAVGSTASDTTTYTMKSGL